MPKRRQKSLAKRDAALEQAHSRFIATEVDAVRARDRGKALTPAQRHAKEAAAARRAWRDPAFQSQRRALIAEKGWKDFKTTVFIVGGVSGVIAAVALLGRK